MTKGAGGNRGGSGQKIPTHPEPTDSGEAAAYTVVDQFLRQVPLDPESMGAAYRLRRHKRAYTAVFTPFVLVKAQTRIDFHRLRLTVIPGQDTANIRLEMDRQIELYQNGQRLAKLVTRQQQIELTWDGSIRNVRFVRIQLAPILLLMHDRRGSIDLKIDGICITDRWSQGTPKTRWLELGAEQIRLEHRDGRGHLQGRLTIGGLTAQTRRAVATDLPGWEPGGYLFTLASLVSQPGQGTLCQLQKMLDLLVREKMQALLYRLKVTGSVHFAVDEMRLGEE